MTSDAERQNFERCLNDYFSEWNVDIDESLTLRENVIANLKALVEIIVEEAECDISRRGTDEPMPDKGAGRGEVGDFIVTVWPLGLCGDWVQITRKEDAHDAEGYEEE